MGLKLVCRELGADCLYVARGKTMEELTADCARHCKGDHSYTDGQLKELNTPEMMKKSKHACFSNKLAGCMYENCGLGELGR